MFTTAVRLFAIVVPLGRQCWGPRVARLPRRGEEMKSSLQSRHRRDEDLFVEMLRGEGSDSFRVVRDFGLNRQVNGGSRSVCTPGDWRRWPFAI